MYRCHLLLPLLLASLTLSGCSSFSGYPDRATNLADELASIKKYLRPQIITDYNDPAITPVGEKKSLRDEIVNARIYATDLHFGAFQQDLRQEGIELNLSSDIAVIGLNLAGTLVGSAATKSMLAAASGGLVAAKTSFDKNVYFEKTMVVLLGEMVAQRKSVLVRIRGNLVKSVDEYPLTQALVDLEDYYNAGTIPGALMEIAEESGAKAKKATEDLEDIIVYKYTKDSAAKLLLNFLMPDGRNEVKASKDKLREWMDKNGLADEEIPFFIHGSQYADKRLQAVRGLNL